MNRALLILLILLINFFTCSSQKNTEIRLMVRGDDMGFSHSGNEAIIKCFKEGIETSIEVIVPSPWFPEAVKLLNENPTVDVGIHIALTSEWDNMKYRPVSHCPSLTDDSGYFFRLYGQTKTIRARRCWKANGKLKKLKKNFEHK